MNSRATSPPLNVPWMTSAASERALSRTRPLLFCAYACALSRVPFPGFLDRPKSGIERARASSRSEFVSTVQSPRIQVRPTGEQTQQRPLPTSPREAEHQCRYTGLCHAFFRQQGAEWPGILNKAFLIVKFNRLRDLFYFTCVIIVFAFVYVSADLRRVAQSLFFCFPGHLC